jgi:hypothetical protein
VHGLYWLTINLAEDRSLLIVVDDAHWADEASLRWLAYLAPRLEEAAVAMLIASRPWYRAFSDAHVEVQSAHFIDDVVIEIGTFCGTHDGDLPTPSRDLPPTGRAVSVPYIHTLRYRDGLHVSFNLLFDRLLMLEQLGLVPAPAAAQ